MPCICVFTTSRRSPPRQCAGHSRQCGSSLLHVALVPASPGEQQATATGIWSFSAFPYAALAFWFKEIPESCLTGLFFSTETWSKCPAPHPSPPPPFRKEKKIPKTFYLLPFCIWSAPCLPSSHSLFIWQGSWWWLWTLSALCPHYTPTCMCSVWLPEI